MWGSGRNPSGLYCCDLSPSPPHPRPVPRDPEVAYGEGASQRLCGEASLSEAKGSCFQVETSTNHSLSDSDSAKLCLMLQGGKGKYKISAEKMFPRPALQLGQWRRVGRERGQRSEATQQGLRHWVEAKVPSVLGGDGRQASGRGLMALCPIASLGLEPVFGEGRIF